jgi:hypothetical protein
MHLVQILLPLYDNAGTAFGILGAKMIPTWQ